MNYQQRNPYIDAISDLVRRLDEIAIDARDQAESSESLLANAAEKYDDMVEKYEEGGEFNLKEWVMLIAKSTAATNWALMDVLGDQRVCARGRSVVRTFARPGWRANFSYGPRHCPGLCQLFGDVPGQRFRSDSVWTRSLCLGRGVRG